MSTVVPPETLYVLRVAAAVERTSSTALDDVADVDGLQARAAAARDRVHERDAAQARDQAAEGPRPARTVDEGQAQDGVVEPGIDDQALRFHLRLRVRVVGVRAAARCRKID